MNRPFSRAITQAFDRMKRLILVAVVITVATVPTLTLSQTATAAQVTDRSLLISSAQPSKTGVKYTFSFIPATSAILQTMSFQACTLAVGACTAPTGLSFTGATVTQSGAGTWTDSGTWAADAVGAGGCTASASVFCVKRTATTAETVNTTQRQIILTGVTNPSGASCSGQVNCTFFVRMTTYSDTGYATSVDAGTVAASTNTYFQINAIIQEQLAFCVGSTTINDATTTIPTCSGITGTSLSLGILSSSYINVSPVQTIAQNANGPQGDGNNGLAELQTNSANGSVVSYDAIQQPGTNHQGGLRVQGSNCNAGVVNTDQCINSIGVTSATLTKGVEDFGFAIGGVNCSLVTASGAYTCNFANGTFNLDPTANYACNGITNVGTPTNTFDTDINQIAGPTSCKYAWDETGTAQNIATSTGGVGGEGLILKFAATPNLVTPTGTYTAQADFVATPTY